MRAATGWSSFTPPGMSYGKPNRSESVFFMTRIIQEKYFLPGFGISTVYVYTSVFYPLPLTVLLATTVLLMCVPLFFLSPLFHLHTVRESPCSPDAL